MADKKDLSLASYTFGVLSIVFAFFNSAAGLVLGIIGFRMSRKKTDELSKKSKKFNKIGIILSLIFLVIQIAASIYFAYHSGSFPVA